MEQKLRKETIFINEKEEFNIKNFSANGRILDLSIEQDKVTHSIRAYISDENVGFDVISICKNVSRQAIFSMDIKSFEKLTRKIKDDQSKIYLLNIILKEIDAKDGYYTIVTR